jgi:hypothetical protein
MQARRTTIIALHIVILLAGWALVSGRQLPIEPLRESGQSVTGAYEGWFGNPDGSYSLLFGYYNRNKKQELDIPVGTDNRIEPGGPDYGQPTHFLTDRQMGVFTVTVPKDFGNKKLTWTLTANGKTTVIPASIDPIYVLGPFNGPNGNTPPFISFEEGAPGVNGPRGHSVSLTTTFPNPLTLTTWLSDDDNLPPATDNKPPRPYPLSVRWSKFRGPGAVTFADNTPATEKIERKAPPAPAISGRATTTATFSEPGEYVLHVLANDATRDQEIGYQCCWSNAQVKVSVKPGVTSKQ